MKSILVIWIVLLTATFTLSAQDSKLHTDGQTVPPVWSSVPPCPVGQYLTEKGCKSPTGNLFVSCHATHEKIDEQSEDTTWRSYCSIQEAIHADQDPPGVTTLKTLFDKPLPLPVPATYEEAMKAIDLFMKKGEYDELKKLGLLPPKDAPAKKPKEKHGRTPNSSTDA